MNCDTIISTLIGGVLSLLGSFLAFRSQIKLSSPKPFLKPSIEKLEPGFAPKIIIRNYGPGHAVKVKASFKAITQDSSEIFLYELEGPGFIPYIDSHNHGVYMYKGNEDLIDKRVVEIIINYESDSGYKRETVWERTEGNISNQMMRNEEFIPKKSK